MAVFKAPVCFINLGLIPYRHRYLTYLYYYLILVMVDFPYPICLEQCREFCEIFNKPFDINTTIFFQEVLEMPALKERNKDLPSLSSHSFPHASTRTSFWWEP